MDMNFKIHGIYNIANYGKIRSPRLLWFLAWTCAIPAHCTHAYKLVICPSFHVAPLHMKPIPYIHATHMPIMHVPPPPNVHVYPSHACVSMFMLIYKLLKTLHHIPLPQRCHDCHPSPLPQVFLHHTHLLHLIVLSPTCPQLFPSFLLSRAFVWRNHWHVAFFLKFSFSLTKMVGNGRWRALYSSPPPPPPCLLM